MSDPKPVTGRALLVSAVSALAVTLVFLFLVANGSAITDIVIGFAFSVPSWVWTCIFGVIMFLCVWSVFLHDILTKAAPKPAPTTDADPKQVP